MSKSSEYNLDDVYWNEHWIMNLLSPYIVVKKTFDEWMFCPDRYSDRVLSHLRNLYNMKREHLLSM